MLVGRQAMNHRKSPSIESFEAIRRRKQIQEN
jgi:hypothetical protein